MNSGVANIVASSTATTSPLIFKYHCMVDVFQCPPSEDVAEPGQSALLGKQYDVKMKTRERFCAINRNIRE